MPGVPGEDTYPEAIIGFRERFAHSACSLNYHNHLLHTGFSECTEAIHHLYH